MTSLTIVIPHWPREKALDDKLQRCIASLGKKRIVVVVNDGIGYARAVNQGVRVASTSHVLICNNDTVLTGGDPSMMLDSFDVTFPVVNGHYGADFCGPVLCFPKDVFEKVGGFDEGYEVGFWEDVDMWMKLKQHGVIARQIQSVHFSHPSPGSTMSMIEGDHEQRNRERFIERWGEIPGKGWV